MASKKVMAYDGAQNVYADGIARQNAQNIERLHPTEITCECRVVPTDAFGRILTGAKVTFNGGTAAAFADGGNIICVDRLSKLTYKVECEGYETVEGSVDFVKGNMLIQPTLGPASTTSVEDPDAAKVTAKIEEHQTGGASDNEL